MKVNQMVSAPTLYERYEPQELSAAELARFEDNGITELWYWYAYGCPDGCGQLIAHKDGRYFLYDLAHCSCYGPVDNWTIQSKSYDSIDDIQKECSNELWENSVQPLVAFIKSLRVLRDSVSKHG